MMCFASCQRAQVAHTSAPSFSLGKPQETARYRAQSKQHFPDLLRACGGRVLCQLGRQDVSAHRTTTPVSDATDRLNAQEYPSGVSSCTPLTEPTYASKRRCVACGGAHDVVNSYASWRAEFAAEVCPTSAS